jgi:DNA-binding NarL/FixJ family response regulator
MTDGAAAPEQRSVLLPGEEAAPRPTLTERHIEILGHVARGRTNRQVGELLGISERTVRNHLRTISKRLATTDRTHAVVLAIGHGWIAVPIEAGDAMLRSEAAHGSASGAAGE